MQRIWGPLFFRSYFCHRRDFCLPVCPFEARFTLKTVLNYHEECNEFADLLFQRPSLWIIFLSRDSLSCGTHSLDHCILFKFIFYTSGYIPPHSCAFHTFYLHLFFFICILPGGLFFLSLMMPLISESSELNFKGLTWTIFCFLLFVVLNFHKI